MKNLLIVSFIYDRKDVLELVSGIKEHFRLYFLTYISKNKVPLGINNLGEIIYWTDFISSNNLIKSINPDKIIFFNIESYNEILLNLAAKNLGIKTYLMDHGIRIYEITNAREESERKNKELQKNPTKAQENSLLSKIKNKLFYFFSYMLLPKDQKKFFKSYKSIRSRNSIFRTLVLIKDSLRLPTSYISFSPATFGFWKKIDHPSSKHEVFYIGFPGFDKFFREDYPTKPDFRKAIYIDQPYHESKIFGWTKIDKKQLIEGLVGLCDKHNIELHLKLHPKSDVSFYKGLQKTMYFRLISNEYLNKNILAYQIVLGFGSTLNYVFLSFPHTVSFSLNFHPDPVSVTSNFTSEGVSQEVNSMKDLNTYFYDLELCRKNQQKHKGSFVDKWMYKFDGKSKRRLNTILLSSKN